ncbi:hypothetical protein O181_089058, partial [Austropuccinia psidii MF-1]|nr:hypothetical protein [Austropuccinia psidii MF-1]
MASSLPIIDISPFLHPHATKDSLSETANLIHQACSKTGFFYLTGHGISKEEMSKILQVTRAFLVDGSEETKARLSIFLNDKARGYQRRGENVTSGKPDWHEALDLYAPSPFGSDGLGKILGGENRYPEEPKIFKQVVENWVKQMCELGQIVMRATAMGLGLSEAEIKKLLDQVQDSFWVLRCIGYPPLPTTYDGVSCGAHKVLISFFGLINPDYGCYTFLHTDSTKGALQVFVPGNHVGEPGRWIEANPLEGAFVVNIGEMWEIWTNGLYKATLHRVIHKGSNYRVS